MPELVAVLRGERMLGFFAAPPRRRRPLLRLHVAPPPAARPRRRAALRPRLHGPRHAGRADVLDAVRRHRPRRGRAHAARGLPPHVAGPPGGLSAPGRRHLLRERPERRRGADGADEVGALGPAGRRAGMGRRDRVGRRRAARGLGRALADRARVPDGRRPRLHHAHRPRRHGQRHRPAAALDRHPLPARGCAGRRALGARRARGGARRPRRRREAWGRSVERPRRPARRGRRHARPRRPRRGRRRAPRGARAGRPGAREPGRAVRSRPGAPSGRRSSASCWPTRRRRRPGSRPSRLAARAFYGDPASWPALGYLPMQPGTRWPPAPDVAPAPVPRRGRRSLRRRRGRRGRGRRRRGVRARGGGPSRAARRARRVARRADLPRDHLRSARVWTGLERQVDPPRRATRGSSATSSSSPPSRCGTTTR